MSRDEFRERNLKEWDIMLNKLFDNHIPTQFSWDNAEDIINICNVLGSDHNLNHTFFPTGGGLDLYGAGKSIEPDCIELYFSSGKSAHIIKPKKLIFQSFQAPYEWAYFRIETSLLAPSGVYEGCRSMNEELVEISPGYYIERYHWDEGYYGHDEGGKDLPLPEQARLIIRHLEGPFVIFAKTSIYNRTSSTYDGRHAKMSAREFSEYIKKGLEANT